MELTASQFADVESAYRSERISASFRDRAARHRQLVRRQRGKATSNIVRRALRAA